MLARRLKMIQREDGIERIPYNVHDAGIFEGRLSKARKHGVMRFDKRHLTGKKNTLSPPARIIQLLILRSRMLVNKKHRRMRQRPRVQSKWTQ